MTSGRALQTYRSNRLQAQRLQETEMSTPLYVVRSTSSMAPFTFTLVYQSKPDPELVS